MFTPPDTLFTWDFWTITDEKGLHHAFFLQAPRNKSNPETRHNMAEVGHAVSKDLKTWEYRGTVVRRGQRGAWNDYAIWTGSVFKTKMGDYAMLLTGRTSRDGGDEQRVGLFFSNDLYNWNEYDANPVFVCDPSIYEPRHHTEFSTTWRDPFVLYDENDDTYKAYTTAQQKNANNETVGCIALATSKNLTDWTVTKPVDVPEYFKVMECPQVVKTDNKWLMLFHIDKAWVLEDAPKEVSRITGSHYFESSSLEGPYKYGGLLLDGGIDLEIGHRWTKYQLRIHDKDNAGCFRAFYWDGYQQDGSFTGGISDPVTLDKELSK